ncbi:hypothetical protein [Sphingobium sp. CCH11-B1]|jgi:hypothetical protein|uniref:hypothetical protein n=1 Tax=Sphingobium sp. CCH11-B1 TaxID=1768781 RepID=UPI000832582F
MTTWPGRFEGRVAVSTGGATPATFEAPILAQPSMGSLRPVRESAAMVCFMTSEERDLMTASTFHTSYGCRPSSALLTAWRPETTGYCNREGGMP